MIHHDERDDVARILELPNVRVARSGSWLDAEPADGGDAA